MMTDEEIREISQRLSRAYLSRDHITLGALLAEVDAKAPEFGQRVRLLLRTADQHRR